MLDMKDIYVSSGSACSSGSIDPSHVLLAIGRSREDAYGAVRMTISEETTREQADAVIDEVKRVVERLRSMSPSYGAFSRGTR
jgi:cysteine desulfurase